MKSSACMSLAFVLLPFCYGPPALADEPAKLPDRYSEIVLHVEGMV